MASSFGFPQQAPGITPGSNERGIAKLHHPDVGSLRLRTAPTDFGWKYSLNKRVDNTYGGRVVQLLGTKIDEFQFSADSGGGGWEYANKISKYMRDVLIAQRNGIPATFEYTTRGWKLNLYVITVPFQDAIEEVKRSFQIQCKVQEDISGVMSKNTLSAELRRLQDGINFRRSKYNDPVYNGAPTDSESSGGFFQVLKNIQEAASNFGQFAPDVNYLPNGLVGGGGNGGFDLANLIGGAK